MSFFARATRDANARADRVRLVASAIAALALTEFFVLTAHSDRHRIGVLSIGTALFGWDANAVLVLQVAGFAETADHALLGAHGSRMRIGAGRGAG